jgi:DNA-binding Lrp family transcriptional regulator
MSAPELDDLDRALLNRIQSNFPIATHPFKQIGEEIGLSEKGVIDRIQRLKAQGIIRRIGGNFVPHKVGHVSTLCAAKVPEDKIELFADVVNRYSGVTHNYMRDNSFNIWFTFIAPSMEEIEANLATIRSKTGITEILNLPATNVFKIKAQFDL